MRLALVRLALLVLAGRASAAAAVSPARLSTAVLCLTLVVWCPAGALAQSRFESWTTENGLPQNSIRDILQTRDGYLWLATEGGLVRFDGARFVVFDKSVPGFESQRIGSLREDRNGALWAGTSDGMLIRYQDGRFTTYGRKDGLPKAGSPAAGGARIEDDDQGHLWVTWIDAVTRLVGPQFTNFVPGDFAMPAPPRHLYLDSWWRQDSTALHVFARGRVQTYALPSAVASAGVTGVNTDARGNIWIRTAGAGVLRASAGRIERFTIQDGLPRNAPDGLFHGDGRGSIWFFERGAGTIDRIQEARRAIDIPTTERLWPDGAPGALGAEDADVPALTLYQPARSQATGTLVVICPGGGYQHLAIDHEGQQVARWFTSRGIAAAVVTYRLGPRYRHPAPLQDVLRAIRLVRSRAAELNVRPDRIGVMGFSAGGHLASSAATLYDLAAAKVEDGLQAVSSRPDFAVLAYPVIVFGADVTHKGSQRNLLGDAASAALVTQLSTDRQVTAQTPPTFLFHTNEDKGVPPQNSVAFYLALKNAGVAAELHIYEKGAHGVGLAPGDRELSTWPDRLIGWMRGRGLLER